MSESEHAGDGEVDKRKKKAKPSGLRRNNTFSYEWISSENDQDIYLKPVHQDPHKAHCAACNSTFQIDWGGIESIKQHEGVKKHKKNVEGYKRLQKNQMRIHGFFSTASNSRYIP